MKTSKTKKAKYRHRKGSSLFRPKTFIPMFGCSRSEYYKRVNDGTAPPPIDVGPMAIALPDYVCEDYIKHLSESEDIFNADRYLEQVGGRVITV